MAYSVSKLNKIANGINGHDDEEEKFDYSVKQLNEMAQSINDDMIRRQVPTYTEEDARSLRSLAQLESTTDSSASFGDLSIKEDDDLYERWKKHYLNGEGQFGAFWKALSKDNKTTLEGDNGEAMKTPEESYQYAKAKLDELSDEQKELVKEAKDASNIAMSSINFNAFTKNTFGDFVGGFGGGGGVGGIASTSDKEKLERQLRKTGLNRDAIKQFEEYQTYADDYENRQQQRQKLKESNEGTIFANTIMSDLLGNIGDVSAFFGSLEKPKDSNLGRNLNSKNYWLSNWATDVQEAQHSNVNENVNNETVADALNLIYDAGNMAIKSAVGAGIGKGATSALGMTGKAAEYTGSIIGTSPYFGGGYAQGIEQGIERGLTEEEAKKEALAMGLLEQGTEIIPGAIGQKIFGKLGAQLSKTAAKELIETGGKELAKDIAKQIGAEAGEELINDIGFSIADAIITGDKSVYNTSVKAHKQEYLEQGYSEEDAQKLAEKDAKVDWIKDTGKDMLMAGLSTSMSGGASMGISTMVDNMASKSLDGNYKNVVNSISDNKEDYKDEEAYNKAMEVKQKAEELSEQDNVSGKDRRQLLQDIYAVNETMPNTDLIENINESVNSPFANVGGFQVAKNDITSQQVAESMASAQNVNDFVEAYRDSQASSNVEARQTGQQYFDTLAPKFDDFNEGSRPLDIAMSQRSAEDIYNAALNNEEVAQEELNTARKQQLFQRGVAQYNLNRQIEAQRQVRQEESKTVAPEKLHNIETSQGKADIADITMSDDGSFVWKKGEEEVVIPKKDISDNAMKRFMVNATNQPTLSAKQLYVDNYDGSIPIGSYNNAYNSAFNAGKLGNGTFKSWLSAKKFYAKQIPVETLEAFYNEGAKQLKGVSKKVTKARVKGTGKVTVEKGVENTPIHRLAEAIASKIGVDFEIRDGSILATDNAKNALKDEEGNEIYSNGQFKADVSKVVLGVNDKAYQTLAHEAIGEFLEAYNPEDMQEIQDTILTYLLEEKGDEYVDNTIKRYQRLYQSAEGSKSYRDAANEMVNDTLIGLFTTDKGAKDFVDWCNSNNKKSTLDKIADFIQAIIDKLKSLISDANLSSQAQSVAKMSEKQAQEIRDRLFKAMDKAIDNYKGAEEGKANANTRHSLDIDDIDEELMSDYELDILNEWFASEQPTKAEKKEAVKFGKGYDFVESGNKKLAYTEDRINYLLDSFAASDPNYAQAYVAYINPIDFLKLTTGANQRAMERIEREGKKLDLEELREETQPLYLNIDEEEGEVIGHEGRHRMYALYKEGYTSVPILLFNYQNKYSKQNINSIDLLPQWFSEKDDNLSDRITVTNLIPFSRGNEEEIRVQYGKGTSADAKFSLDVDSIETNNNNIFQFDNENLNKEEQTGVFKKVEASRGLPYIWIIEPKYVSNDTWKALAEIEGTDWKNLKDRAVRSNKYYVDNSYTQDFLEYLTGTEVEDNTKLADAKVEEAEETFGTTSSWEDTGYLTTNGSQIDLSVKDSGASYREDHNSISEIMDSNGVDAVYDFLKLGNIRIIPEVSGIELIEEPNSEQYDKLYDYFAYNNGEARVDLSNDKGGGEGTILYREGTSPQRILNDIENYFETGEVPEGTDDGNTYYSLDVDYQQAVEDNDVEKMEELVRQAANNAGFDSPLLYHGTQHFGFTEIDLKRMDDKQSIFLTSNPEIASTYSGTRQKKKISEAIKEDPMKVETEDLADRLNETVADDGVDHKYEYFNAEKIDKLHDQNLKYIDDVIKMIKDVKDTSDYPENVAKNFSYLKIILYSNTPGNILADKETRGRFTTYLWLIANNESPLQNKVKDDFLKIENSIRKEDVLKNDVDTDEVILLSELDGYSMEAYTPMEARRFLRRQAGQGIYSMYAKLGKTLTVDGKGQNWNRIYGWLTDYLKSFTVDNTSLIKEGNQAVLYSEDGRKLLNKKVSENEEMTTELHQDLVDMYFTIKSRASTSTTRDISEFAKKSGYDSVVIKNITDNGGRNIDVGYKEKADIYILFNPNDIKSADPITYDDNGDVIPLSERFNTDNEDIRYSLSSDAWEGKQRYVDRVMNENAKVDTLSEEEHEVLRQLAKYRHELHTSWDDIFNSETDDILDDFMEFVEENNLPINFNYDDLITDIDYYELLDNEEKEEYEKQAEEFNKENPNSVFPMTAYQMWKEDGNYDEFASQMESLNKQIEDYLASVDAEHGTHYAPTGIARSRYSLDVPTTYALDEEYSPFIDDDIAETKESKGAFVEIIKAANSTLNYRISDKRIEDIADKVIAQYSSKINKDFVTKNLRNIFGAMSDNNIEDMSNALINLSEEVIRQSEDVDPYEKENYEDFARNMPTFTLSENQKQEAINIMGDWNTVFAAVGRFLNNDSHTLDSNTYWDICDNALAHGYTMDRDASDTEQLSNIISAIDALTPQSRALFKGADITDASLVTANEIMQQYYDYALKDKQANANLKDIKADLRTQVDDYKKAIGKQYQEQVKRLQKEIKDLKEQQKYANQKGQQLYDRLAKAESQAGGKEASKKEVKENFKKFSDAMPKFWLTDEQFKQAIEDMGAWNSVWSRLKYYMNKNAQDLDDAMYKQIADLAKQYGYDNMPESTEHKVKEIITAIEMIKNPAYKGDNATIKKLAYENWQLSSDLRQAERMAQRDKQSISRQVEREAKNKHLKSIRNQAIRLIKMIDAPTRDKFVPDVIKEQTIEMLQALDFVTYRVRKNGKLVPWGEEKGGEPTKTTQEWHQRMELLQNALNELEEVPKTELVERYGASANYVFNLSVQMGDVTKGLLDQFLEETKDSKVRLSTLKSDKLKILDDFMKSFNATINKAQEAFIDGKNVKLEQIGKDIVSEIGELNSLNAIEGSGKKKVLDFLNLDMAEPVTFFSELGETFEKMFWHLAQGKNVRDKHIFDTEDAFAKKKEELEIGKNEPNEWEKGVKSFKNGRLQLTTAQIMSLYAAYQRSQARRHILFGGVMSEDKSLITRKDRKAKRVQNNPVHLTPHDVEEITSTLTDKQKALADFMVEYMSNEVSSWGNRVSQLKWGIKLFTESHYFPIKTYDKTRPSKVQEENGNGSLYALQNQGFTKPLQQDANNALILDDIFSVFADHVAKMAAYDGYVIPISDFMRVYNFAESEKQFVNFGVEEGNHRNDESVKGQIERVFGKGGNDYVRRFIKNVNEDYGEGGSVSFIDKLFSNNKAQAVLFNGRVVIQQPTAYPRAMEVIEGKYLVKALSVAGVGIRKKIQRSKSHNSLAKFKSKGYYETSIGPSMKQMITGTATPKEKFNEVAGALAGLMDDFTWSVIYNAAELKVQAEQPKLEKNSKEYFAAVNKIADEAFIKTQVVDSVFTKSQMMRSRDTGDKMLTAFMAEPTKYYNMLHRGVFNMIQTGDKKVFAKALYLFVIGQVLNSVAQSLYDAWRDDDDEKNAMEKFLNALIGIDDIAEANGAWATMQAILKTNLFENLLPLNLLPVVKEVTSALAGWDSKNMSTQAIYDIIGDVQKIFNAAEGKGNLTTYGVLNAAGHALSLGTGMPISQAMREIKDLYNNFNNLWDGENIVKTETKTDRNKKYFAKSDSITEGAKKVYDDKLEENLDKGKTQEEADKQAKSDAKGAITTYYKEKLIKLKDTNMSEAVTLRADLVKAYVSLGDTQKQANSKIEQWFK